MIKLLAALVIFELIQVTPHGAERYDFRTSYGCTLAGRVGFRDHGYPYVCVRRP